MDMQPALTAGLRTSGQDAKEAQAPEHAGLSGHTGVGEATVHHDSRLLGTVHLLSSATTTPSSRWN
jgi:hypothetical protein